MWRLETGGNKLAGCGYSFPGWSAGLSAGFGNGQALREATKQFSVLVPVTPVKE